jgi:hypothetical protein
MLIIGSEALRHYFEDFDRKPKDIDIAVQDKSKRINSTLEYLYNPVILKYQQGGYLKPEYMLNLKVSHLFWNISWDKHMWDVQFLLSKGYEIDYSMCKELYNFWNGNIHRKRHINFNKSKEEFFNLPKEAGLEHDEIHRIINPEPLYLKVLQGEVKVDINLLDKLNYDDKFNLFKEEIYVMGFERYRNLPSYRHVQRKMIKHYIVNNAPFKGGLFVIENYIKYLGLRFDFIAFINNTIGNYGTV